LLVFERLLEYEDKCYEVNDLKYSLMKEVEKPKRTRGIYLVILFMMISIVIQYITFVLSIEIFMSPVNVVALIITIISTVGLWLMKKWGAALTAILSGMGITLCIWNLQLEYLLSLKPELLEVSWMCGGVTPTASSIGLVLYVLIAVYIFKWIFANRFS